MDNETAKLEQRLEQLTAVIDSAMDAIIGMDESQVVEYFNPAAEHMFQRTAAEVIGQPLTILMPARFRDSHQKHVRAFGEAFATNRSAGDLGTIRGLRADGTEFPLEVAISQSVVGGRKTYTAVARDATARHEAEHALRQAEARYRAIFENAVESIVQTTPDGRILAANPAAAKMLGFESPEQLLASKDFLEEHFYVQPKRRLEFMALMEQRGDVTGFESEVYRKDGSTLWISENSKAIRDANGTVIYYQGAAQDITARKLAEEARRKAEENYRAIFENATEAITQTTADGRYLTANPSAAKMLGYASPEDLIGRVKNLNQRFYVKPGRRLEFMQLMEKHGQIAGFVSEVYRKDGSTLWITENSRAVHDENGTLLYYEGTAQDITARKQAEEALRVSNEQLEAMIRTAPIGVVVLDREGNVKRWNPANERMFGWTEAEVLGRPLPYVPEDKRAEHKALRDRVLGGDSFSGVEVSRRRKDGSPIIISVYTAPLRDEQGNVRGILGLNVDVTERKQEQEQLQAAETRYRLLVERVPAITYIVSAEAPHRTLYISPQVKSLLGFKPEEWIADPDLWERQLHPDDRERVLAEDEASRDQQRPFSAEYRIHARDGRVVWLHDETHHIHEPGMPPFSQGIEFDITERKQAEEQIRQQVLHMSALRRIDAAISGTFDLKVMLSIVLDNIMQVLQVDAACVSLLRPESLALEVSAAKGFHTRQIESSPLSLSAGIGAKVMLERQAIHTGDLHAAAEAGRRRSLMDAERFIAYYGVPLVSKGRVTGVLELFHRSALHRNEEWLRLLDALAAQTAIAIDSASLFQDVQRSNVDLALAYEATIEGWSRALDLRDRETEGHTQRVTERTMELARSLGVSQEELPHIRRGALLHDIGKIGVPDSILLKPGPLTDEEWIVMRRHPVVAYEMLAPIAYLRSALDIPYCHHEKWDGSGYPRGLKGEEIPLAARIFAVVDVWDALSSERPYRGPWPQNKILAHLQNQAGLHFDPSILQAFLRHLAKS